MRSFIICTFHEMLGWSSQGGWDMRSIWHAWKRWEIHKFLVQKPEGRRPLGRPRCRCEDNIRMDIR